MYAYLRHYTRLSDAKGMAVLQEHAASAVGNAPTANSPLTGAGGYSLQLVLPPTADGTTQDPVLLPVKLVQHTAQVGASQSATHQHRAKSC